MSGSSSPAYLSYRAQLLSGSAYSDACGLKILSVILVGSRLGRREDGHSPAGAVGGRDGGQSVDYGSIGCRDGMQG